MSMIDFKKLIPWFNANPNYKTMQSLKTDTQSYSIVNKIIWNKIEIIRFVYLLKQRKKFGRFLCTVVSGM